MAEVEHAFACFVINNRASKSACSTTLTEKLVYMNLIARS